MENPSQDQSNNLPSTQDKVPHGGERPDFELGPLNTGELPRLVKELDARETVPDALVGRTKIEDTADALAATTYESSVDTQPGKRPSRSAKIGAAVAGVFLTAVSVFGISKALNNGGESNLPPESKPVATAPAETNEPNGENTPKTLDEYITQLEEFQGIESLVLPAADASADKFGQWSVDIYNKASLASCEKVDEIKEAAVNLALSDTPVENEDLYSGIAKANTGNIMKASRGSKWMNDPRSVNWYDQYVKNNIWGIKNCITNTKDQILSKRFISAADLGVNADNHQVYEVKYEVTTGDPNSTLNGERDETYVTDIEDGHIIVLDSAEH